MPRLLPTNDNRIWVVRHNPGLGILLLRTVVFIHRRNLRSFAVGRGFTLGGSVPSTPSRFFLMIALFIPTVPDRQGGDASERQADHGLTVVDCARRRRWQPMRSYSLTGMRTNVGEMRMKRSRPARINLQMVVRPTPSRRANSAAEWYCASDRTADLRRPRLPVG